MIPLGVLGSARHAASSGPAFEFLQAASSDSTASTSHTFAAQNLGTSGTGRVIVVAVVAQASVSSVTVGGSGVTLDVSHAGGSSSVAWIGHLTIAAGTSADVVVSLGASTNRCGIGLWRINAPVTVADTGTGTAGLTVTTLTGDMVVAACFGSAASTWTNVTERYDLADNGIYHSGADATSAANGDIAVTSSAGFAKADAVYRFV